MSISSESLFHITSKLDYFKGIFKQGFRYSFLVEELPFGGYMESPVTLMSGLKAVCFYDIPLSMSDEQNGGVEAQKRAAHRRRYTPFQC
jgi:hypothetical protein